MNKRMIICLAGAHGSGKTTLAQSLAGNLGLPFYGSNAAKIHEEFGFSPSQNIPIVDRVDVQYAILEDWVEKIESASVGGGVFDRSPLDFIAYLLSETTRNLGDDTSDEIVGYVDRCIELLQDIDLILLCEGSRYSLPERENGKPKAGNTAYSILIESIIKGIGADVPEEVCPIYTLPFVGIVERVGLAVEIVAESFDAEAENVINSRWAKAPG